MPAPPTSCCASPATPSAISPWPPASGAIWVGDLPRRSDCDGWPFAARWRRFARIEHDAFVALGCDRVDDADVLGRAAVVDQVADGALLVARYIGVVAGEPRLGLAHQHHGVHAGDVVGPALLDRLGGFEARVALRPDVPEEIGAPVDAGLDAARIVGRGRAALRPR